MRNWQLIKPTKLTIREFGSITCVEYLLLIRILMVMYGHPPVQVQVLSSAKPLFWTFFVAIKYYTWYNMWC